MMALLTHPSSTAAIAPTFSMIIMGRPVVAKHSVVEAVRRMRSLMLRSRN